MYLTLCREGSSVDFFWGGGIFKYALRGNVPTLLNGTNMECSAYILRAPRIAYVNYTLTCKSYKTYAYKSDNK